MIDGCPAGLELSVDDLIPDLKRRAPGTSPRVSPRKEDDLPEILSGLFNGQTTGAPISILIRNQDARPEAYKTLEHIMRPGHANFTYLAKYGIFDHRGGGRASARETACRVAAGAVAKKLLSCWGICCTATFVETDEIVEEGDSLGGVVEFRAEGVPVGLGDPVYEKLGASLAKAMLSIPASKGVEIGEGFAATTMRGSEHNDLFTTTDGVIHPASNHAGGMLGGISTGLPIVGRVAFKPTSSIKKEQATVTAAGKQTLFKPPLEARNDPCIAIRAAPVVEAMLALVLVDALLMNRLAKL